LLAYAWEGDVNRIRAAIGRHQLAVGLAAGLVIAGTVAGTGAAIAAIPSTSTKLINACVNKSTGAVRVIDYQAGKRCVSKTERSVSWAARGATGPAGPAGAPGAAGTPGAPGQKGDTGAPGTAQAYALIQSDGTVLHSKGTFTVSHAPLSGFYCVTVAGVDPSSTIALVGPNFENDSTNVGTPGSTGVVEYDSGSCSTSAGAGFSVDTFARGATVVANQEGFVFLVP
jgi:hypothetical protein